MSGDHNFKERPNDIMVAVDDTACPDSYNDYEDDDDDEPLLHTITNNGPCLLEEGGWRRWFYPTGFCNPWTRPHKSKLKREPLFFVVDGIEHADLAPLLISLGSSITATTGSSSSTLDEDDDDDNKDDTSYCTADGSISSESSNDDINNMLENDPVENHHDMCTPATTNYAGAFRSYEQRWSPEQIELVATSWNLTDHQRQCLLDMQQRIHLNDNDEENSHSYWLNEPNQCIYILEYTLWKSVDRAVDLWHHIAHWRNLQTDSHPQSLLYKRATDHVTATTITVDNILDTYTPPPDFDWFPHFVVLQGVDRVGDPVVCTRIGATDCCALFDRYGRDEMLRYALYCQEKLARGVWLDDYERVHNKKVTRLTAIVDLKGLNAKHARAGLLPLLGAVARFAQDNYLELAKLVVIMNAPPIFQWIWNFCKHFVDDDLRETMVFASSSAEACQLLEQYMEPSILPHCLHPGGEDGPVARGYEPVQLLGGPLLPPGDYQRYERIIC